MDIYSIRKQNLISLIGKRKKNVCAQLWDISPAYLSQILSEKTDKNLGDEVARRIEAVEQLPYGWMDAAHADESETPGPLQTAGDKILEMLQKHGRSLGEEARRRIADAVADSPVDLPATQADGSNVIVADFSRRPTVGTGDILVPQYDIRGSLGHGQVPAEYVEFVRNIVVDASELEKTGVEFTSHTNLQLITGWGQSMRGTINDKDPLFIDRGITEFVGEGVYFLTWLNHMYIKRVQMLDAEHFLLVSDNKEFEPMKARMDDVFFHAKAVIVWNVKRL